MCELRLHKSCVLKHPAVERKRIKAQSRIFQQHGAPAYIRGQHAILWPQVGCRNPLRSGEPGQQGEFVIADVDRLWFVDHKPIASGQLAQRREGLRIAAGEQKIVFAAQNRQHVARDAWAAPQKSAAVTHVNSLSA